MQRKELIWALVYEYARATDAHRYMREYNAKYPDSLVDVRDFERMLSEASQSLDAALEDACNAADLLPLTPVSPAG